MSTTLSISGVVNGLNGDIVMQKFLKRGKQIMKYEFESEIKQLEGKIKWNVFYFPYSVIEEFGSKGNIPVLIKVDGYSFEHTLLPSKNGHYLVYNKFIKQAVGKGIGDTVYVTLEKDTRQRKYKAPPHLEQALEKSGVLVQYLEQPDFIKREQVNFIEIAKKEETKQNRLNKLITLLASKEISHT